MQRQPISRIIACTGAAVCALGVAGDSIVSTSVASPSQNNNVALPDSLTLTGVVRDFRERSVAGGHPDFERQPTSGFGHYAYIAADELDADGKPVMATTGRRVSAQFRDAQGRNIMPPRPHVASRSGDQPGTVATSNGGAVTSADSFAQWFRDVPGVNMSAPLSITLKRQAGTNIYTFNDRTDDFYKSRGGFFPIDGELFGNSGGSTPTKNYHFTYEIDTTFVYRQGSGQVFTFTGDDDVFVFIDGKCVIDIGGVHSAISQTIDLDRLEWLQDGKRYSLKFFFAERHRTEANFRIDTTINLQNADLPQTTFFYD